MKDAASKNTKKTHPAGLRLPNDLKTAIFKASQKASGKAGKHVSEHKLMIQGLYRIFLPEKSN